MDKPTTSLVPAEGRALITSRLAFEQQLQRWQEEQVHALAPMIDFGALPEQYALVPAKVLINPDPAMGEVYFSGQFCKPREVALSTIGLQKLAHCAGISIYTRRTDPRTFPHYWEFQAIASWMGLDGAKQTGSATKEWDLRDGSEQLKGFTPKQITEARKHGARNAETRAINAVIRQLGIKQKYTLDELKKPFGLVRLVFQPNMSDPVQRQVVAQQALNSTAAMYPAVGETPALLAGTVIEGQLAEDPPPASTPPPVSAPPSAGTAAAPAAEDFEELPAAAAPAEPEQPRYRIVKAERQVREAQGLAPLYFFTTEPPAKFRTDDGAIAKLGAEAKRDGALVEIDSERRDDALWIVELRRVAAGAATPPAAGAAETLLAAGACYVEKIEEKKGVTAGKNGKPDRPWIRRIVVFSTGETGTTFSDTIAKDAEDARVKRTPVIPTLEDNPNYPDQQTLTGLALVDTRQRSFLESEL